MSSKQKLLVGFLVVFLVVLISTSCIQDVVTPAYVDPYSIDYSGEEPTMFTPWTSYWDLQRIERAVDHQHFFTQKTILRLAEDDLDHYSYLKDSLLIGAVSAQELKAAIFSPNGPLGMLMASLPAFGLGALLIRKPGDTKVIEELKNNKGV